MAKLHITTYAPPESDVPHWALYLKGDEVHIIYEVVGGPLAYETRVRYDTQPKESVYYEENIYMCHIVVHDVQEFTDLVARVEPDYEKAFWSCQDYVCDILDLPEFSGFIPEYMIFDFNTSLETL
ncbi:hypothetical protein K3495_g4829 [Podosphaera aphanis]|nr:hypothetical protein K3495_g4829 [Podosphaera aphanis]